MTEFNNGEIFETFFSSYNNNKTSQEQALVILEQLKSAVLNQDTEVIENICNFLKEKTQNTELEPIVKDACNNIFNDIKCTSTILKYTFPTEERPLPEENISVMSKGIGSCKHAIIYVDDDFDDFSEEEIEYMHKLGIAQIDIINLSTNDKIYSGDLDEEVQKDDKRDGWLILIGVIIFIGVGLAITKITSK